MKKFSLDQLTQGIRDRHIGAERSRLVEKWSRTGLLRGLEGTKRETMSQLLENQAAQVLRESASLGQGGGSLTSSGQLQGFSNIAFPIVRRVFGGLVANELVSVQPMTLPSGLIFYLDYTYGSNVGGDAGLSLDPAAANETYTRGQSLFGNPAGRAVQNGADAAGGMFDLVGTGYSRVHSGSTAISGSNVNVGAWTGAGGAWAAATTVDTVSDFSGSNAKFVSFDPQVEADVETGAVDFSFVFFSVAELTTKMPNVDLNALDQLAITDFPGGTAATWGPTYQSGTNVLNLRRLTKRGNWNGTVFAPNHLTGDHVMFVVKGLPTLGTATTKITGVLGENLEVDGVTGAAHVVPSFESNFGSSPSPAIPEIDIKIESIAITAQARKLRARWSPELAQDLNAYHSMDAEVELTSILSEQIALEIDREILNDLVTQANGANYYWSRTPGRFVNKVTGERQALADAYQIGPSFTGTVREWYETLVETIIDVANTIHRKTLRGSANFVVTSPDVCTILESSVLYKPKFSLDADGQVSTPFTIGAEAVGSVSNRFTVYKDPYFPRNKILVGFKGGSYLETGYVYAPYVPLIVTPTIFAQDDFTPRKGVLTRYGKKTVRSDFYGTVTVTDMNVI